MSRKQHASPNAQMPTLAGSVALKNTVSAELCTAETPPAAGTFCFLSAERLRTTYACLRPGAPQRTAEHTAQLPIRVVPTDNGSYEVIDGFKRLNAWRQQAHKLIPVVLEPPCSSTEHKRLLLLANCPPRTITALDEARVVCSLMSQERMSLKGIARQLRHKPQWVARRVDIATHLSPTAQNCLSRAAIGPTLAHSLDWGAA